MPHIQSGLTALILASQNGRLEVVKALVAAGADVNAKDNVGVRAWGADRPRGEGEPRNMSSL